MTAKFERCDAGLTGWKYRFCPQDRGRDSGAIWDEALGWCYDQFGPPSHWTETHGWTRGTISIMFEDATWATAFRIRWC